ncbi:hypothetical protein CL655_00785 [bacterium]|nr:hypothetical protein [bacterium]|tara:strand:- start:7098 stop:7373 length:276 start_codon:yes stop_codon:yes gene_type:complete
MTKVLFYQSQSVPRNLCDIEKPSVLIDSEDVSLVAEVADFLRTVHDSNVSVRSGKLGGYWLTVQDGRSVYPSSLRVASWLYRVEVAQPQLQ